MKSIQTIVRFGLNVLLAALPVACVAPEGSEIELSEDGFEDATGEAQSALESDPCLTKHVTFDESNQAFTSGYSLSSSGGLTAGQYRVTTDATTCNGGFRGKAPDGGKFACYDGAIAAGTNAACVTVQIEAGVTYEASVSARSLSNSGAYRPSMQFFVAGAGCGTAKPLDYNSSEYAWTTVSCEFTRATTATVSVCVRDVTTAAFGNDFALDELLLLPVHGEQLGACQDDACTTRSCTGTGRCEALPKIVCDDEN